MDTDLITFFDVETPNTHNDRICSIGIVQTDLEGSVVDSTSLLIDPESRFDEINMRLTGISPVDVRGEMTFPEAWDELLADYLNGPLVVAHNARFDLCVLTKTLKAYGMREPVFDYACTQRMSMALLPDIRCYKLPEVCSALGLEMGRHHRAQSDADACKNVFWKLSDLADDLRPFFRVYRYEEPLHYGERKQRHFSDKTSKMRYLKSLFEQAMGKDPMPIEYAFSILGFIGSYEDLEGDDALRPVVSILQSATKDGSIDASEMRQIADALDHFVDPVSNEADGIEFPGKTFCLTGTFEHGTREQVSDHIASRGGEVVKSVTKKCCYVVVGGCGSDAWSMGNYGTKVKKALDLQSKGCPIEIVGECAIYGE